MASSKFDWIVKECLTGAGYTATVMEPVGIERYTFKSVRVLENLDDSYDFFYHQTTNNPVRIHNFTISITSTL